MAIDEKGYLAVIKTAEKANGEGEENEETACFLRSGEPAVFTMETVKDGISEAVKAAGSAQRAVLVLGCNPVINSKEEIDRTTLALPPFQQKLGGCRKSSKSGYCCSSVVQLPLHHQPASGRNAGYPLERVGKPGAWERGCRRPQWKDVTRGTSEYDLVQIR